MGHKRARERRREPDDTEGTESKPEHRVEQTTDTDREGSRPERPPGIVNRSTVDTSGRGAATTGVHGAVGGVGPGSGYVDYERGPDRAVLSARHGIEVRRSEAERLRRLESEHGTEQVGRWADEGMTVDTMGRPRDMQAFRERQADRSAEIPADIERRNQASVRRNAARNRDEDSAGATGTPDAVRRVVSSPGRSMNESVQREMESKMGGDFSDVQVHTGPQAAAAAESIHARAFTVGNHVAFNRGEYQPGSDDGKRVLAHELTHVRQQTDGRVSLLPKADAEQSGTSGGFGMHVQPKLEVSSPDDPAEKEARQVAEQVVQMDEAGSETPAQSSGSDAQQADAGAVAETNATEGTQRDVFAQTVPANQVAASGGGRESTVKQGVQGGGKALPSSTKSEMKSKMGADFSNVSVHTGSQADAAAKSIGAKAYTMGSDIAFSKGSYNPHSQSGKKLLAHELTHVRQQTGGRVSLLPQTDAEHPGTAVECMHVQPKLEVSSPDDPAEKEARAVAEQVMEMDATGGSAHAVGDRASREHEAAPVQPNATTVQRAGGWSSWLGLRDDQVPPGEISEGKLRIVEALGYNWKKKGAVPRNVLTDVNYIVTCYERLAKDEHVQMYLMINYLSNNATIVDGTHGLQVDVPSNVMSARSFGDVITGKAMKTSLINAFNTQPYLTAPIKKGIPLVNMIAVGYSKFQMKKTMETIGKPPKQRDDADKERIEEFREGVKYKLYHAIAMAHPRTNQPDYIKEMYETGRAKHEKWNKEIARIAGSYGGGGYQEDQIESRD